MDDLTAFQRDILYCLHKAADTGETPYGLGIKRELESYYNHDINHGRLYPNLDELVDKDLIEKGALDKRTNFYEITERGRRGIEARHEWEDQPFGANREGDDQSREGETAQPSA